MGKRWCLYMTLSGPAGSATRLEREWTCCFRRLFVTSSVVVQFDFLKCDATSQHIALFDMVFITVYFWQVFGF